MRFVKYLRSFSHPARQEMKGEKHMGELRTRKRGKGWEWSFEGARINGKRKPISKGGYRTKAEAVAAGTKAKAEYDSAGRVFQPSEVSVSDYLDYWLENYVRRNLAYNTQKDYQKKVDLHIRPAFGKYRLVSLEPDLIQKWVDRKKGDGYSRSMVQNLLCCLSGALRYAVHPCGYIASNPCEYVRIPKIETPEDRKAHTEYICSKEDYAQIMERFPEGNIFHLPLMAGYHCGARIGEIYGIDLLRDMDFETHTLHIRHQLSKENNCWYYRPPKYHSMRSIRIDPIFEAALKAEIHIRKVNQIKYGPYFTKTYLLPDMSLQQARADVELPYTEIMPLSARENGELLTPYTFKYCARVIHQELSNPLFHSHCLRHTHGTILAESGAQPKTVMERLGHRDIKTTLERYIFNTDKMQEDAVNLFIKATS